MSDLVLGIRLTADGKDLVGAVKVSTDEIDKMTSATKRAGSEAQKLNSQQKSLGDQFNRTSGASGLLAQSMDRLSGMVKIAAASVGLFKLAQMAKDATMLAARYETLAIVMRVAGNNAGYTGAQMDVYAKQLQASGISMQQSRLAVINLATANIDLANASKLGRAAQDLAVVGQINSSEALGRLVYGLKSGQVEVLRTLGLNVNFESGYKTLAAQIGTTSDKLTEKQKMLARTDVALAEAARYNGIYEESMKTAGKAITSLPRYWEDLKTRMGDAFLPLLSESVNDLTKALKAANVELEKAGSQDQIDSIGTSLANGFRNVTQTVTVMGLELAYVFNAIGLEIGGLAAQAAAIARLDFSGAAEIGRLMKADAEANRKAVDAATAAVLKGSQAEVAAAGVSEKARMAAAAASNKAAEAAAQKLAAEELARAAAKKSEEAYQGLLDGLRKKLLLDKESTELEQLAVTLAEKKYAALGKEKKATLENLAREVDAKTQALAVDKAALEYATAQAAAQEKNDETLADFNTTMGEHLDQLRFETELYGQSEEQKQIAIELRKLDAEYTKAQIGLDEDQLATLTAIYGLQRAQLPAAIAANNAARVQADNSKQLAKDLERGQVDAWQSIDRTAHDTFISIFDSGKSAFDRLRDTLKNGLYELLYQMTRKKWVINIAGSVSGTGVATSAFGASAAAGASTGAAGAASSVSTLASLGNMFSGGASTATGMANGVFQDIGVKLGSQWIADIGNYGFGMPFISGLVMAASGNVAGGIGSTLGGIAGSYFGPIGTVVGSTLGGMIGSMFGGDDDRQAEYLGSYATGTISRSGISSGRYQTLMGTAPNDYWAGGANAPLPAASVDAVNKAIDEVFTSLENQAKALGISTASIADVSVQIANSGKGVEQDLADALAQTSDAVALKLMPNLEALKQGTESLTETFVRVTNAQIAYNAQVAQTRQSWQDQVDVLTGARTQAQIDRAAQLASTTDAATQALMNQTFALQDQKTAADAAAQAAQDQAAAEAQLAQTRQSWQDQIDVLTGARTQTQIERTAQLASTTDAATLALMNQTFALQDQKTAADAAAQAAQDQAAAEAQLAQTRQSWQDQVDVLTGTRTQTQIDRAAQLASTTDAATQALMNHTFALQDQKTAADAAAQAAKDQAASAQQLRQTIASNESSFASSVQGLASRLHIDTLQNAANSLATSNFLSPTDRFAAAQKQLAETYAQANGGDLGAAQNYPAMLQSTLSLARDVYASGPQFQQIFVEGNRELNSLLTKQQGTQNEILKDIPVTIQQSGADTVATLKAGFAKMTDELAALRAELRRLAA